MSTLARRWHLPPWAIDWNAPDVTAWALREAAILEFERVAGRD